MLALRALQFASLNTLNLNTVFTALTNTITRQPFHRKYKSIHTFSHSLREVAKISNLMNALGGIRTRVPRVVTSA